MVTYLSYLGRYRVLHSDLICGSGKKVDIYTFPKQNIVDYARKVTTKELSTLRLQDTANTQ